MPPIPTYLESGQKRVFAGARDYPGWCRSGRDEASALQALLAYATRYQRALAAAGIDFEPPGDLADLAVVERHPGSVTTDFGAPDSELGADTLPMDSGEYQRQIAILLACWEAFLAAVKRAEGLELRKGPRGGGRELAQIVSHVLEAEAAYLRKLGWKQTGEFDAASEEAFAAIRQQVLSATQAAHNSELPKMGPRGGRMWTLRFYLRRAAWHLLDHAWEIEDRI